MNKHHTGQGSICPFKKITIKPEQLMLSLSAALCMGQSVRDTAFHEALKCRDPEYISIEKEHLNLCMIRCTALYYLI
jgi:hypothetical protein